MAHGGSEMNGYEVPLSIYQRLTAATPDEKREIVLSLIEQHPAGRLELAGLDGSGADLTCLDLSSETLKRQYQERLERVPYPHWWEPDRGRARLWQADLRFADLREADLRYVDLRQADLSRADLRQADLRRANLREASLRRANLACADGRRANLREADLRRADLSGADLQRADLRDSDLRRADVTGAALQRARLWNANLRDAKLTGADLRGAYLRGANLRGGFLGGANLQEAILQDARLEGVDLSTAVVANIHVRGAWLDRTRLRADQLGGAIGEELEKDYQAARDGYRILKRNFESLGYYEDARWAYRKERTMEKLLAREKGNRGQYIVAELVGRATGYGTGIWNVLLTLIVVYVLFGIGYTVLSLWQGWPVPVSVLRGVSVSLGAMLGMGPGVLVDLNTPPLDKAALDAVTASQAFLGLLLIGVLGFVVANRIRRS